MDEAPNYIHKCPKCGGILNWTTRYDGAPELTHTRTEVRCPNCHIFALGAAVPKEETQHEIQILYEILKEQ